MLRGGRLNLLLRVPGHVQHAHQHAGAEPARPGTYPVSVTHRSSGASVRLLKQRHWTTHEHTRLHDLLTRYPPGPLTTQDWKHVSQHLSTGRSWQACKQRVVRLSRSAQHRQWAPLVRRPRWTREREVLLVGLKLAAGRGAAWGQVAEALDAGFTAEQCAGKYARLMMAGGGKRGDRGGAGAQGSRGFNATPWRPSGDLPVPRWSEGEDEQLERLVARNGVFDFRRLRTELPGFRYATMYRALHRVFLASPVDTTTTAQRGCMDGRAGKWSEEEHAKMVRIVDACRYNASEVSQRWLSEESPMAMLSPAPQSAKLPGLMLALSRDTGRSDNHPQQAVAPRRKIDWTQVARQLATGRTPAQCRARWYNAHVTSPPNSLPWSLAEDLVLYSRYSRAPGRWTWIARGLPGRPLGLLRARVAGLRRIIGLLRACRGRAWDPLEDGLREVHERCEIAWWHAGDMPGYRNQDHAVCPYDLDLTGISAIVPAA